MKYSNINVQTSLTLQLSDHLRSSGYNIRWYIDGKEEPHTGNGDPIDTITLSNKGSGDPTFMVTRLNSGDSQEVEVPVLTLSLAGGPRTGPRLGLGHSEFYRSRAIVVDGFVRDSIQQHELADVLYSWVGEGDPRLQVWDYETDASDPSPLPPVYVDKVRIPPSVDWDLLVDEVEAVKYYVQLHFVINYEE